MKGDALRAHGLQRDQPRAVVHVITETHQPLANDPAEGRPDYGAIQPQLEQIERRLGAAHLGFRPLDIGGGGGLLLQQLLGSGEGLLRQIAVRLGPGDFRL